MKLSKIYSNNNKFKTINFNDNLNFIIGKVSKKYDMNKDTHNLGKTLLISLIDFLFLKKISRDKNHFLNKKQELFNDYIFFLEIKLNFDSYLTISRSVENRSRASFKFHKIPNQNYINCNDWDYENLSLNTKFSDKNAINVLNNILNFDVLEKFDFRKSINYFLRTQDDYQNVFHLSKYSGKHIHWKPLLFNILGFDESFMEKKYILEDKLKDQKDLIKGLKEQLSIDPSEVDKINGLIDIKQQEKEELEVLIDDFDFYNTEREINKKLVDEIESEISNLNSIEYKLKFEINKIEESLKVDVDFNLEEIKEIFDQVEIYFPEQLEKNYKQLVDFNNEIINERKEYLLESLKTKKNRLQKTQEELKNYNKERKKRLSFIKEKDSFQKFKNYQSDLIEIENHISDLNNQIEQIDITKRINKEIEQVKFEIENYVEEIEEQIKKGNDIYRNIKLLFNKFLKSIINHNGLLSLTQNKNGNIDFNAEIIDSDTKDITSQSKGNTYKKLLCASFDLSLLVNYSDNNFYKFVYHDGILESLDNRKKINYLDLIRELSQKYNLQIILTSIEDSLPVHRSGERYDINKEEISLILDDSEDDKGRLFEMSF